jgi:hypothetical protein
MKLQACTSAVGVEPRLQEACATSRTVAGDSCRRRSRKERDQSLKIVVWRDKDTGRGHVGRSSERESRESGGSRVDTGGSRVEDRESRARQQEVGEALHWPARIKPSPLGCWRHWTSGTRSSQPATKSASCAQETLWSACRTSSSSSGGMKRIRTVVDG